MLVIVVDVVVTRFMNIGFIIIGADIKRSIKIMWTRFVFVSNIIVSKITIVGLPHNTNVIVIAVFINIIIDIVVADVVTHFILTILIRTIFFLVGYNIVIKVITVDIMFLPSNINIIVGANIVIFNITVVI